MFHSSPICLKKTVEADAATFSVETHHLLRHPMASREIPRQSPPPIPRHPRWDIAGRLEMLRGAAESRDVSQDPMGLHVCVNYSGKTPMRSRRMPCIVHTESRRLRVRLELGVDRVIVGTKRILV